MSLDRHSNWQKEHALFSVFRLPGLCVHDHGYFYSHGCVLKTRLSKRSVFRKLTTEMYLKSLEQAAYTLTVASPVFGPAERRVLSIGSNSNSSHPRSCMHACMPALQKRYTRTRAVGYSRTSRSTLYARHTISDVKKSLKVSILFFPIAVPVHGHV